MARRHLKRSLYRAIQEGLRRLELDDPNQFAYQDGFRIARRIHTVLWNAGEDMGEYGSGDFIELVQEFLQGRDDLDPDEVLSQFEECWPKIRIPEGQDPLSFAYNSVLRSDYRVPLSSSFATETATEHAAVLATMAEAMCASTLDGCTCYLPARRIAPWLGRSPRYVECLKRRLLSDGTLRVIHEARPGHCAQVRYVPEGARVPPQDSAQRSYAQSAQRS